MESPDPGFPLGTVEFELIEPALQTCTPPLSKPNNAVAEFANHKERFMRFESFSFGAIQIDGVFYEHDIVIDRGEIRKRKKGPSKQFREEFGHTPLSIKEKIPWKCRRLVIGTGTGALPVMEQVKEEARRRGIELFIAPTARAIKLLSRKPTDTNAVLHITC